MHAIIFVQMLLINDAVSYPSSHELNVSYTRLSQYILTLRLSNELQIWIQISRVKIQQYQPYYPELLL